MTSSLELWKVADDYVRVLNGERIKQAREEAQMVQQDVADALRVSVSTVSNWERGKTVPKSRQAALVKLLRLTPDDLAGPPESTGPTLAGASDVELAMEFLRRMQARTGPPPGSKDKAWAPAAPPPFEVENPPLAEST